MEDHQKRGLCYNCDKKYSLDHKCKEQKVFHIDVFDSTHYEEINIDDTTKMETVDHTPPMQEAVEL